MIDFIKTHRTRTIFLLLICILIMGLQAGCLSNKNNEQLVNPTSTVGIEQQKFSPPVGPAYYWNFDETSGTFATDAVAGMVASFVDVPTWTTGIVNNGLSFDGTNDYLTTTTLNLGASFSFSFWLKPDVLGGDPIGKINNVSFYSTTDGKIRFVIGNGSSWGNQIWSPVNTLVVGKWSHIAGTYDGNNTNLYVDGNLMGTASNPGLTLNTTLEIGQKAGQYFDGMIDEFIIYTRPINQTEIVAYLSSVLVDGDNWWKLDDDQPNTTAVDTISGKTATFNNTPLWVDGISGKALQFDGVDDSLATPELYLGNEFSVGFWLKPSDFTNIGDPFGKLFKISFAVYQDASMRFVLGDGITWKTWIVTPANTLVADEWAYAVGTYDGTDYKFYLNGVLVGSETATGLLINTDVTIGEKNNFYFKGVLDEVRTYREVLTPQQILANYQQYNTPYTGSWWKLDDGTSVTTPVDSIGGMDATFVNTPTWTAGVLNGGLQFDGVNDSLVTPTINLGSNFTISFWINPDEYRTGDPLGKFQDISFCTYDDGHIRFALGENNTWIKVESSPASLLIGQWQLVTGTYDGTTMSFYLNKQLIGTNTISNFIFNTDLEIGQKNGYFFKGKMDEIKTSDQVMTFQQISDYYDSIVNTTPPIPGTPTGEYIFFTFESEATNGVAIETDYRDVWGIAELNEWSPNGMVISPDENEVWRAWDNQLQVAVAANGANVYFTDRVEGGNGPTAFWPRISMIEPIEETYAALTFHITNQTENPTISPDGSMLVYESDAQLHPNYDDTGVELYLVKIDHAGNPIEGLPSNLQTVRLTNNDGDDFDPSFSPNGNLIVFVRESDGNRLYLLDISNQGIGSNLRQLSGESNCSDPSFSPDGNKIVFVKNSMLYEIPVSGGIAVPVYTRLSGDEGFTDSRTPVYNNTGTRIYFVRNTLTPQGLNPALRIHYVDLAETTPIAKPVLIDGIDNQLDQNGQSLGVISTTNVRDLAITWNATATIPDNVWGGGAEFDHNLVCQSWRFEGPEIYVLNEDGSDQRFITVNQFVIGESPYWPRYSLDGSKVAFQTGAFYSYGEIGVVNSDGSGFSLLRNGSDPVISPNNSAIYYCDDHAFGSNNEYNSREVYKLEFGNVPMRLTSMGTGFGGQLCSSIDVNYDETQLIFLQKTGSVSDKTIQYTIYKYDITTGETDEICVLSSDIMVAQSLRLSLLGDKMLVIAKHYDNTYEIQEYMLNNFTVTGSNSYFLHSDNYGSEFASAVYSNNSNIIYYTYKITGEFQGSSDIWKLNTTTGSREQVTHGGNFWYVDYNRQWSNP